MFMFNVIQINIYDLRFCFRFFLCFVFCCFFLFMQFMYMGKYFCVAVFNLYHTVRLLLSLLLLLLRINSHKYNTKSKQQQQLENFN